MSSQNEQESDIVVKKISKFLTSQMCFLSAMEAFGKRENGLMVIPEDKFDECLNEAKSVNKLIGEIYGLNTDLVQEIQQTQKEVAELEALYKL